jgi:hypothetical protein
MRKHSEMQKYFYRARITALTVGALLFARSLFAIILFITVLFQSVSFRRLGLYEKVLRLAEPRKTFGEGRQEEFRVLAFRVPSPGR